MSLTPWPLIALVNLMHPMTKTDAPAELRDEVRAYVDARLGEMDSMIAPERRVALDRLADYVRRTRGAEGAAQLTFICTHNSRRSHMSQVWAAVAAAYFHVERVRCYSGGTEVTAFNPRAVEALRRAGLSVLKTTDDANPIYHVQFAENRPPLTAFSKHYSQSPNPAKEFCAVMVCDQADASCPVVSGATGRFSVPYVDPKIADDTAGEAETYDARCRQIAREMLYVFSQVAATSE